MARDDKSAVLARPLLEVNGDVERFVLLVFDLFDFLQAHLHALADRFAQIGFGGGCAFLFGGRQREGAQIGQFLRRVVEHGGFLN